MVGLLSVFVGVLEGAWWDEGVFGGVFLGFLDLVEGKSRKKSGL